MATSSKLKPVKEKPVFNPDATYTWKANDVFAITGAQLEGLTKLLSSVVNTPEVQRAMSAVEAYKIVASILQGGVEEGLILPTEEVEAQEMAPPETEPGTDEV